VFETRCTGCGEKTYPNELQYPKNGFIRYATIANIVDKISAPLIRHVLSTVDAARYTNCYVCMYVCIFDDSVYL